MRGLIENQVKQNTRVIKQAIDESQKAHSHLQKEGKMLKDEVVRELDAKANGGSNIRHILKESQAKFENQRNSLAN